MNSSPRTLVIAPYPGEFGWELMNWQGRVRWLLSRGISDRRVWEDGGLRLFRCPPLLLGPSSNNCGMDRHSHGRPSYERIMVLGSEDRRRLYEQDAPVVEVTYCAVGGCRLPGEAEEDHRVDAEGRRIDASLLQTAVARAARDELQRMELDASAIDVLQPDYRATMWPSSSGHQLFMELRVATPLSTDVVLVPRRRASASERNQPQAWWEDLAARLRGDGLTVGFYPPDMGSAIAQLSAARLAIGASTGGLHLASLCRCPHYVWGSGSDVRWTPLRITNRQRYETIWNPFGTPCVYDGGGWQPTLDHVFDQVRRTLDSIGLKDGGMRADAWSFKPAWRVRRKLSRVLDPGSGGWPWPWRVRELVREHVL